MSTLCTYLFIASLGFLAAGFACLIAATGRERRGTRELREELDGERARRVACEQERNRLRERTKFPFTASW